MKDASVRNNGKTLFGAPFVLLMLCLLALLVSLAGLYRTSTVANSRAADLQVSWQELASDGVEGSELLAIDKLMQGISRPVPALYSAASWSLALAVLSLVFLAWFIKSARAAARTQDKLTAGGHQHAQAAMERLLDEMAPLASGNLDVKATARDGTAGALADAFNYAVSELQRSVGVQVSVSRAISEAVDQSHELAGIIEKRCVAQSGHVHRSSNYLSGMSGTASELSGHTAETSMACKSLATQVNTASDVLGPSIKQWQDTGDIHATTHRHLQSLQASIESIDEGIEHLEQFARRAEVFAMNLDLQSSGAGEALSKDESLSPVSALFDQVVMLAEESRSIGGRIASMTKTIKTDAADAVSLISQLRAISGDHLDHMLEVESALKGMRDDVLHMQSHVTTMAEQAVEHASVVRDLSSNMDLVNQITQQTTDDVQSNAHHFEDLRKLSAELRQGLSDLKLPEAESSQVTKSARANAAKRAAQRAVISG